jgi:hypothetical protein
MDFELFANKKVRFMPKSKPFICDKKNMHEFERILTGSVKNSIKDCGNKPIRLHFSGGCDSVALFFCLLNITKKFTCHTYVFKKNDDFKSSVQICGLYGIELVCHTITESDIVENLKYLKLKYGFSGKVNLQCMVGYLAIAKEVKDSLFLNGAYADALFGSFKSLVFCGAKTDKRIFDKKRNESLNKPNNAASDYLEKIMDKESGSIIAYPFYDKSVVDYFMGFDFKSLGGVQKKIFYSAFGDRLPKKHKVRRRSQQIDSGVRDLGLY